MADYRKIKNPVFQQVCERITRKECIPFLGSGISNNCKYSGGNKRFKNREGHRVLGMKKGLRRKQPLWREKSLGELCEEYLWKTRRESKNSLKELVDALEIKEFTQLKPTTAHYCIVLLAREGLLPQIITTNYDSALEHAFMDSLGVPWLSNDVDNLSVVHDQQSCVHQKPGRQGSGETLHLYKINGCACALNEQGDYYARILLTMTQLQTWRDRRWAKDIFRVALRSNMVLFSGFGSDEPQVIHTVHQILDEYSSFGPRENGPLSLRHLPPNAPVIQCFEKAPSFCQLQITNNYAQSFGGKFDSEFATRLILTNQELFGHEEELSADDFWFWVYQEVQFRLVDWILEQAASGHLAVSAIPNARHLFGDIRKDWGGTLSAMAGKLLAPKPSSNWQTVLSNWLSILSNGGKSYVPLNMNRNMIAEFFWVLYYSQAQFSKTIIVGDQGGESWLVLKNADDRRCVVFVKRRQYRTTLKNNPSNQLATAAVALSRDFSTDMGHPGRFRLKLKENGKHAMRVVLAFSFPDIVELGREKYSENGQIEGFDLLNGIMQYPSKFWTKLQQGKKEKYGTRSIS